MRLKRLTGWVFLTVAIPVSGLFQLSLPWRAVISKGTLTFGEISLL